MLEESSTSKTLRIERNFELISHENITTEKHLNGSKLHLNKKRYGNFLILHHWHCFIHNLENSKVSSTVTCDEFNAKKLEENTNLKFIRKGNFNRVVLAHINIYLIRNKYDNLVQQITNNVDILMISKTKLDNSFSEGQLLIPGYNSPYRFDKNCRGGDIILYVREDIPFKLLLIENQPIEGYYVEINLRKNKWLLCGKYNPHRNNTGNHLDSLSKNLAKYPSAYDNYIVIGDFNIEADSKEMSCFCDTFDLTSLIKEPTCYKNPDNLSCIDLISTNLLVFETRV